MTDTNTIVSQVASIHTRAMLVSLRLSTWTARKYDKKISAEVTSSHGAASDAGRFNKMLIPTDSISYKALNQLVGQIRTAHYANTLAWSDEGWRLLPTANYTAYTDMVRKFRHQFETLLRDFLVEYPSLRDGAKVRLNGMYREEDYPSTSQIAGKFGFYLDFSPLPAQGDFRVDLPSDEIKRIEAEVQGKVSSATEDAMKDAWKRLYDCVNHVREKLNDPKGIFRDSMISNAAELCDILGRLNVTGDSNLDEMRSEVSQYIASQDADMLRDDSVLRSDTATMADDIFNRMSAFYTPEN